MADNSEALSLQPTKSHLSRTVRGGDPGYGSGYEDAEATPDKGNSRPQEIPCAILPYDEALSETHDQALEKIGFGKLQWMLFVILGLGLMGDSIELLMIAYILPGAEKDFCMTAPMKGWLGKEEKTMFVLREVHAYLYTYHSSAGHCILTVTALTLD